MPNFAILRFAKHKSLGTISASSAHMTRDRKTANADPAKLGLNRVLAGDETSPSDLVRARHHAATIARGKTPRKNGVIAIEVMLGMSPGWWPKATPGQRDAWTRRSKQWLTDTFGDGNVVSLILHYDETTPHLTGFIVPVDPHSGDLNASRWLDGKKKLADLQTAYAATVGPLGLARGIEKSTSTHQTVKQFYAALAEPVGTITAPIVPTPPLLSRDAWAHAETARIAEAISADAKILQMQARAGIATAQRAATLQASADATRDLRNRIRDIPLAEVLTRLGLTPAKDDKKQYVDGEKRFRITLQNTKFYDHAAGKGGGGAIDLAMHVLDTDFKSATSWLASTIGVDETVRAVAARALENAESTVAAAQQKGPFQLPAMEPDRDLIRRYLCKKRGLDEALVEHLIDAGQIVSDARRNVGFVMRDAEDRPMGLELKGTDEDRTFTGLALGSSREATFRLGHDPGASGQAPRVVLTESAIDALSYFEMHASDQPLLVASTSGTRSVPPESLEAALQAAPEVAVAYDRDAAGHQASSGLLNALRHLYRGVVKRLLPTAKDWNDDLRAILRGKTAKPAVPARAKRPARDTGGMGF